MATLTEMFHAYIAKLFPKDAEFADDGALKLRVIFPIAETTTGNRYSRPVVLQFEPYVIDEFKLAIDGGNRQRQDRIGERLCEILRTSLQQYDVNGQRDSAFKVYIDSRATDQ